MKKIFECTIMFICWSAVCCAQPSANLNGVGSNQLVVTDATLSGNGTPTAPLKIAKQSAANGQLLKWNGDSWLPGADGLSLPFKSQTSLGSYGISIAHNATSGTTYGGYFESYSTTGKGVFGRAVATSGINAGGRFESDSPNGMGVVGKASTVGGPNFGGYFYSYSVAGTGVYGHVFATSGKNYGGWFESSSPFGIGVYGISPSIGVNGCALANNGIGVYAKAPVYAGVFDGCVVINKDLFVLGEILGDEGNISSEIDHPLDPANKLLRHSFVESPEMINVYSGNVVTDAMGSTVIILPDYFETLNKDFRYQLTVIGDYAQAIIAEKINNNRFTIRTDKPNIEVSWQVTGVRKDPWAEMNPIVVEEFKKPELRGYYLYPQGYGQPENRSILREDTRMVQGIPAESEVVPIETIEKQQ